MVPEGRGITAKDATPITPTWQAFTVFKYIIMHPFCIYIYTYLQIVHKYIWKKRQKAGRIK